MKRMYHGWVVVAFFVLCAPVIAQAGVIDTYVESILTANVATLNKILAKNYLHISANGCPQDKAAFIDAIKNKKKVVERMTLSDIVSTRYGTMTIGTGNVHLHGTFDTPVPQGMQRVTIVTQEVKGKPQIVLFQATPILDAEGKPAKDCSVCKINGQTCQ